MKNLLLALLCFTLFSAKAGNEISLIVPQSLTDTSITIMAINDVQALLSQACGCKVSVNNNDAGILLKLPAIDKQKAAELNRFAKDAKFPYRNYPEHNYAWKSEAQGGKTVLELEATSWQGVSFGLYGLLQEKLGFSFYHPKASIIPHWDNWPLQKNFTWQAKALFDKHGFHLHTQHPLELTEQLHDPTMPNALNDIKQYIDWLARNGQDYFEFCLLESIDRKLWPAHAKAMVDYTHSRGLIAAVDLSLHMIQQKTFQLYRSSTNKKKQIEKNLVWLMEANWDVINMEFNTAEFISGNMSKKGELRLFIIDWLKKNTNTKLMGRQHVVKHENEANNKKVFVWDSTSAALDKERGVLSHTVMFYDMTEPNAPVYENENQRHMFQFLLTQMKERETWYYPESAYWVTFDVSIPMLLLPYLTARLSDIDTCVKYNVPGHITFSSGWEWGYWLIDWSIARWSWQHTTDGIAEKRTPEMYANIVFNQNNRKTFKQQLDLQQTYLKDSNMIKWMTAMTILDEVSIKALSDEYQPRPDWSYKFLRRKADKNLIAQIRNTTLNQLAAFAAQTHKAANEMRLQSDSIQSELIDGIEITGLRAQHRYYTLSYTLAKRESKIDKRKCNCDSLLQKAKQIRGQAQQIVDKRQQHYRYPVDLIAGKRWDHTSYHFGYLYPVSRLHSWHREEDQARLNKYGPFFENIMNMWRIAGIID